jgi:rod shape-determining protein MreC
MKKFLRSRSGIIVLVFFGLFLLIFLQRVGAFKTLENTATFIFKPVQTFFYNSSVKVKDFFIYFKDTKALDQENKNLKEQIAKLSSENLSLKMNIEDSKIITEELNYIKEHGYNAVSAKVIGRGSDEYLQVIILNKGQSDGLQKDYPVISNNGLIIGKIIEVNKQISKVLLLSDNHSKISAIVKNESLSPGIVSGQYGITLKMELIPQDHTILNDQMVTTGGSEQYIPADLIIGKITKITKKDGELFQEAVIEPIIDYQNVNIVTIILPNYE